MGILDDEEALIVCNGYKDEEYIETALMCSKLGARCSSWSRNSPNST